MSYEYRVYDIKWDSSDQTLPNEIIVLLPDWFVDADDSEFGDTLIEVDKVWDDELKNAVEDLVGTRPDQFGFEPIGWKPHAK